ncbi:hypothetical protein OCB07_15920 [Bacillus cereus]|nr:hypothetical protein [Bacillus cereus]
MSFIDIVQEVAKEYWVGKLQESQLKEIFALLDDETVWIGIKWGWMTTEVRSEIHIVTHKYINKLWKNEE